MSRKSKVFIHQLRHAALVLACASATAAHADVTFKCASPQQAQRLEQEVTQYLQELKVSPGTFVVSRVSAGQPVVSVATSKAVRSSTTTLRFDPLLGIEDETLMLPKGKNGQLQPITTVSRKEIVYALLSPGRQTSFEEAGCTVDALKEHVGARQHIVAWSEKLQWQWPDGGPASWNTKYWRKGTPLPGVAVEDALRDSLVHQDKYAIGCYTATKMVIAQGVVDFYSRVSQKKGAWDEVKTRLWHDADPLVGIEGRAMWQFEDGFDPKEADVPGKLLKVQHDVAAGNFVPGDWVYVLNTDKDSWEKTGYEGSNAIYMGRNRFNDHYDDNGGHYLYHEKLRMVYQWRNGVFSRSRHFDRITDVSPELLHQLELTPVQGGFVLAQRSVPYTFGFESVPALPKP